MMIEGSKKYAETNRKVDVKKNDSVRGSGRLEIGHHFECWENQSRTNTVRDAGD